MDDYTNEINTNKKSIILSRKKFKSIITGDLEMEAEL
jgi:hypothetical protein